MGDTVLLYLHAGYAGAFLRSSRFRHDHSGGTLRERVLWAQKKGLNWDQHGKVKKERKKEVKRKEPIIKKWTSKNFRYLNNISTAWETGKTLM